MDTGSDHLTYLAGPFFGNGLDFVDLERVMLERWQPEWVEREPELTAKAWFDYRHAHPALRAYFFQHSYTLAWRRAYRRFYDHQAYVQNVVPWKRGDLFQNAKQTVQRTMRLMGVVDEVGLPYDVFFDAAIHHFMQKREYANRWKDKLAGAKIPPIQILGDGQALIWAQERFDRLNARRIIWASHPSYRVENYRGLPWQIEHQRHLCIEAKKRGAGCARLVGALISEHKMLTEIGAARVLGVEMVRKARKFYA